MSLILGNVLRFFRSVTMILGAALLLYVGYVLADSAVFQARGRHDLAHPTQTRDKLVLRHVAPTRGAPPGALLWGARRDPPSEVIADIAIPRIGLDTVVVKNDTSQDMDLAAVHIAGTALPGEPGNIGIAAHRDRFFRPLRNVRIGDLVVIKTSFERVSYIVDSIEIVPPNQIDVLDPTRAPNLTLVTCFPFDYIGSAPYRFVVRAHRISDTHARA